MYFGRNTCVKCAYMKFKEDKFARDIRGVYRAASTMLIDREFRFAVVFCNLPWSFVKRGRLKTEEIPRIMISVMFRCHDNAGSRGIRLIRPRA